MDEAEAAMQRLEAIGIGRDRINAKEVAPALDGSAATGGVFVSVKVTTEQVQPANEILKSHSTPFETAAPVAEDRTADFRTEPAIAPEPAGRPLPRFEAEAAPEPTRREIPAARPAAKVQASGFERAKLGRNLVIYGLLLVIAFVIGAWLGMVT